jgi:PAS domain S-box-containing protein
MVLPDLLGATLGRYHVDERLGTGEMTVVYRAAEGPAARPVALKVLDPSLAGRSGFLPRFIEQTETLGGLGDPAIVPVYEIATSGDLTYLAMRLVRGGTLKNLLGSRPLDAHAARRILQDVGRALHHAHEAGVVHLNLKPSNVLIETDGSVMVTDFGLASPRLGRAMGTPGYMSPEQAKGMSVDSRSDVHALGLLLFEMLTGTMAYGGRTEPGMILATINDPAPSARARNLRVPPALDDILFSALAKDPAERPSTVLELLDRLDQVPLGPAPDGRVDDQFGVMIEAALDPVLAIDARGAITHWNSRAEATFGWRRDQVIGRPALTTLIARRHREPFEHLLAGGYTWSPEGRPVEIGALHRDGHQLTLEVSLSPVKLPVATSVVAFCRDVSERKEAERVAAVRDAVKSVIAEAEPGEQLMQGVVEVVCSTLGWPAGAVWLFSPARSRLRCHMFWHAPSLAGAELKALSQSVDQAPGAGLPGRAWLAREPVWQPEIDQLAKSARERAALRAGLRSAGAFPIVGEGARPVGVLEFFSSTAETPGAARLAEVEAAGRRLGRALGEAAASGATRVRYKLDTRNTHLAFSCAFMKLLTVHGIFRDFSGWLDIEGNDPTTTRAHCTIRTASVDTGSLDRDYHLCSADFFAVERFPTMVFHSTRVEPLGDERFRLFGELTIREVTRPIRLEVRLEDRDIDELGVERMTLTAGTVINRLSWFLDWEKALQAGRWIVGNEVRLDLVITLVRRPGVREQVL